MKIVCDNRLRHVNSTGLNVRPNRVALGTSHPGKRHSRNVVATDSTTFLRERKKKSSEYTGVERKSEKENGE